MQAVQHRQVSDEINAHPAWARLGIIDDQWHIFVRQVGQNNQRHTQTQHYQAGRIEAMQATLPKVKEIQL